MTLPPFPQTLSSESLVRALAALGCEHNGLLPYATPPSTATAAATTAAAASTTVSFHSLLAQAHPDHVIARAALLRLVNQVLCYSLPYINLNVPEEKLRKDCMGADDTIDVSPSVLAPVHPPLHTPPQSQSHPQSHPQPHPHPSSSTTNGMLQLPLPLWSPPCTARRLRALRRLLFAHTKSSFFESVLDVTTAPTPLHQDEYEDPREIKSLRINRVRATQSRLASIPSPIERMRQVHTSYHTTPTPHHTTPHPHPHPIITQPIITYPIITYPIRTHPTINLTPSRPLICQ